MKKIVTICAILLLSAVSVSAASEKVGPNVAGGGKSLPKKKPVKKLSGKEKAELSRKQGEQQARKHELEIRRREYQQSLDAQRRGMMEMQKQMQQQRGK